MFDIFGIKKRKRIRIDQYKEEYKKLNLEERSEYVNYLTRVSSLEFFKNKYLEERIKAVFEVEKEENPVFEDFMNCISENKSKYLH